MTEKQENILTTALKLFATTGYDATSTSRVAKEAGVSEGLIFRHFKNKEGLLSAILEHGQEKAMKVYADALIQSTPKDMLKHILTMPFELEEGQYHYWKLIYALKWRADVYDDHMSRPIKLSLIGAFTELGYEDPTAEAETIMLILDGIATMMLLHPPAEPARIKRALLAKYQLDI